MVVIIVTAALGDEVEGAFIPVRWSLDIFVAVSVKRRSSHANIAQMLPAKTKTPVERDRSGGVKLISPSRSGKLIRSSFLDWYNRGGLVNRGKSENVVPTNSGTEKVKSRTYNDAQSHSLLKQFQTLLKQSQTLLKPTSKS